MGRLRKASAGECTRYEPKLFTQGATASQTQACTLVTSRFPEPLSQRKLEQAAQGAGQVVEVKRALQGCVNADPAYPAHQLGVCHVFAHHHEEHIARVGV